ncbi:unnamed protein product [Nesidiocoris tenuis]|uniref:RING-type E3 ubiquitin transferase n=1 Tax=Nesidiocoris tenuis TaxID=355587 RepID=A0A6H5HTQ5_9HEMI|nr:unnamed protein product [Nesidiocoris tenuis]CAB0021074.1 unnamed protein product [Nesidiocoris tenuis]
MLQLLALLCQNAVEALNRGSASPRNLPDVTFESSQSPAKPTGQICVVCMEKLTSPTTTPCGHIFCWNCITEWAQNEERCPICREAVVACRLVPLRNYS